MKAMLEEARGILKSDPKLTSLEVREEGGELHLTRGDSRFARLIPTDTEGVWRLEHFEIKEGWRCLDFKGDLRECLDFLLENVHYQFWEG